ncbi:MAG: VOC family protein [Chitinophagaceae bacterium]
MKHAISWFEIPATDLDRAAAFYETIFGFSLIPADMPGIRMRMFPVQDMECVGGAIVATGDGLLTSSATDGVLIYLNGNPDLQNVLDKVEGAGGSIVLPKTEISPEYGYMALFTDTEGNRIGLHSAPDNMKG